MKKREATRERIISKAGEVFFEKGLAETTMEEIAEQSECHRRTLYRYFPRKEDLVYELVIDSIEKMNIFQREHYNSLAGSGHDRFYEFLKALAGYMDNRRPMVRFMGEFDFFFNQDAAYQPPKETAGRFAGIIHETEELLSCILDKGLSDGSVALPCNKEIFIPTVTSVLWGLAQRIALRAALIQAEFGFSGMDIAYTQIDLYAAAIRASD